MASRSFWAGTVLDDQRRPDPLVIVIISLFFLLIQPGKQAMTGLGIDGPVHDRYLVQ